MILQKFQLEKMDMVQEYRQIILSKQEVIAALEAHGRMVADYLPDGKIIELELIGYSSIMITVATGPDAQQASVLFNDGKILNALVRFCIENNIMLPRDGRKSVVVSDGNVSLTIQLELDTSVGNSLDTSFAAMHAVAS